MTKRTISKFVSVAALGALVIAFGVILLALAARLFVSTIVAPGIGGGIVFSVSRRAFTAVLVTLFALIAAGLLLIARALRRRHLH